MSKRTGLVFVTAVMASIAVGAVACSDDGNLRGGGSSGSNNTSGGTQPPGTQPPGTQPPGTEGQPACSTTSEIQGDIAKSCYVGSEKTWLLKGLVTVKAGATITINKGTTIQGDNASKAILLVEPGAKIVAQGTADEPIVFTSQAAEGSRKAGDWGGIVILGNAPVNFPGGKGNIEGILKTVSGTSYGGSDPNDNSGIIKYVRIEYAGIVLSQDNEVNGLTFGGVGAG